MKKIFSIIFLSFFAFSSVSSAVDSNKLSAAEEKQIAKTAERICDGMMPLYAIALESYYKNNSEQVVKSELDKKIGSDMKKKVFYTEYLEKDPLITAVMSVTSKHSKKIMEKYPGDQEMYKKSIEITRTVSLPPVCRSDIKEVLRQAQQE